MFELVVVPFPSSPEPLDPQQTMLWSRFEGNAADSLHMRTYVRYPRGVEPLDSRAGNRVGSRVGSRGSSLLPKRDLRALEQVVEIARGSGTLVSSKDRSIEVSGPLRALVPHLQRGIVAVVDGEPGHGSTTLALQFGAAVSALGEWISILDPEGSLSGLALLEAGIVTERCAVVRRVPTDRWALVVASLLDGVSLVIAEAPSRLRAADARRLIARARERAALLVITGPWPAEAALRMRAEGGEWVGLGDGSGSLDRRDVRARLETRRGIEHAEISSIAHAG